MRGGATSTCIARVIQTGVSATHEAAAPMTHPSWTRSSHSWSSAPAALLPLDAALPPHRCGSPRRPQPHRLFSQLRIVQAPQQKDAALWMRSTGPIVHIKSMIGRSEGPSVQQLTYFVIGFVEGYSEKFGGQSAVDPHHPPPKPDHEMKPCEG